MKAEHNAVVFGAVVNYYFYLYDVGFVYTVFGLGSISSNFLFKFLSNILAIAKAISSSFFSNSSLAFSS